MRETATPTPMHDDGRAGRALLAHLRHELRTPLNAVIGYSELLLEEEDAGEFNDGLRKMLAAGRELLAFVNDLLDPTLLEAKMSELAAEPHVAGVRHQLRTSLTTVSGYCELLLEEAAEGGRAEVIGDLGRIHRSAEKFLTLIDGVVDLARIEKEAEAFVTQAAAVPGMIREAVSDLRPFAADGAEALRSAKGSLLVVDDNEINRDLLARRLAREGHQVSVAADGRQALEKIEFANAGHNHPYLLRPGEPPALLNHHNSPAIGAMKKVVYPTHHIQLRPGDRLFLYTDGVTEAMNEAGELFSEDRLEQALARSCGSSLEETTRGVSKEVRRFADGAPQSDDVAMLLVKYRG